MIQVKICGINDPLAFDTAVADLLKLIDAAHARASEGEIVQALQTVWGDYRETPVF